MVRECLSAISISPLHHFTTSPFHYFTTLHGAGLAQRSRNSRRHSLGSSLKSELVNTIKSIRRECAKPARWGYYSDHPFTLSPLHPFTSIFSIILTTTILPRAYYSSKLFLSGISIGANMIQFCSKIWHHALPFHHFTISPFHQRPYCTYL